MIRPRYHLQLVVLFEAALLSSSSVLVRAQDVAIQVSDLHDQPIVGAIFSTKGSGSTSPPSDVGGRTQIQPPRGLQVGDELALVLVKSNQKRLQFFSPWQGRATIPKSQGFIQVVLGVIGDRAALSNPQVIASFATEIHKLNESSSGEFPALELNRKVFSLTTGFNVRDVDSSIRMLAGDPKRLESVENAGQRAFVLDYVKKYHAGPQ